MTMSMDKDMEPNTVSLLQSMRGSMSSRAIGVWLIAPTLLVACCSGGGADDIDEMDVFNNEQDVLDGIAEPLTDVADVDVGVPTEVENVAQQVDYSAPSDAAVVLALPSLSKKVFFDYDKANLSRDFRSLLRDYAETLKEQPQLQLRVEGHADERGTPEYNLALGERRAKAVRDYLVENGVAGYRIVTVSYGEERPVALGANEAAWAQNRRSELTFQ